MDQNSASPSPTQPDTAAGAVQNPDSDAGALENAPDASQPGTAPTGSANTPPPKKGKGIKAFIGKFNLYLLLFVFVLVMAGVILGIAYFQGKKANTNNIQSQNLSQSTLQQIANTDATVGDPKQVLNIESNAVFAGQVLVRDSLQVAGALQVGGALTIDSVNVSGSANLNTVSVSKNLSVGGSETIQGQLTTGQGLQVNGGGSFTNTLSAPQLTTSVLQLNGPLTLTNHIIAGGPTPSTSGGPALGSGGTASIGGSDTAGLISINTGNGPGAGCFVNVRFASQFSTAPYIVISPVGVEAGNIAYYLDRSASGFSVCDATTPPANVSFAFDYFVVD
jgi:cytoskeletal protein CcmA (bactofilin family)